MGPSQTQKLLYSKGNHTQNEETVLRMGGKKICKQSVWQGINLQNTHSLCNSVTKQNNSTKKWAEDLNIHFSKVDIQMAIKHVKRCSMSLIIRGMQIKTTLRHQLTLVRMVFNKKSLNSKCWRESFLVGM